MKLLTPAMLLILSTASACGTAESDDGDAMPTAPTAAPDDDGTGEGSDSGGEAPASEAGPSTGDDSGDPTGANSTAADGVTTDAGGDAPNQLPPRSHAALVPWLQADSYAGWHAESGVHTSAGPHGDGVRTFLNDALFDSLDAGNPTHPEGAAVVKELYADGEISGWAVMIKVADGGADG